MSNNILQQVRQVARKAAKMGHGWKTLKARIILEQELLGRK